MRIFFRGNAPETLFGGSTPGPLFGEGFPRTPSFLRGYRPGPCFRGFAPNAPSSFFLFAKKEKSTKKEIRRLHEFC